MAGGLPGDRPGGDFGGGLAVPVASPHLGTIFKLDGNGGRLVFVVDMSGSMRNDGRHITTLQHLLQAAEKCPSLVLPTRHTSLVFANPVL
jgi:hypothetical protein